jgi:hypothetical protein
MWSLLQNGLLRRLDCIVVLGRNLVIVGGDDRFRRRLNSIERLEWWIYCGDVWKVRLVVRQSKNLDCYNDYNDNENLDDNFIELRE